MTIIASATRSSPSYWGRRCIRISTKGDSCTTTSQHAGGTGAAVSFSYAGCNAVFLDVSGVGSGPPKAVLCLWQGANPRAHVNLRDDAVSLPQHLGQGPHQRLRQTAIVKIQQYLIVQKQRGGGGERRGGDRRERLGKAGRFQDNKGPSRLRHRVRNLNLVPASEIILS